MGKYYYIQNFNIFSFYGNVALSSRFIQRRAALNLQKNENTIILNKTYKSD